MPRFYTPPGPPTSSNPGLPGDNPVPCPELTEGSGAVAHCPEWPPLPLTRANRKRGAKLSWTPAAATFVVAAGSCWCRGPRYRMLPPW